jgi:hypothetical protein
MDAPAPGATETPGADWLDEKPVTRRPTRLASNGYEPVTFSVPTISG